ncbi:MAG: restriction endonuclease subunit S [candidate division KSB1 bacterium]|nr:restriction endonuclease subunit S [candidate division KSB1 bacterium]
MSEWEIQTLGDLVTLQRGIDLPDNRRKEGEIPVIGSFGITGFHNEAAMTGPGVTVGRSGASIGVVSYINSDYWPLNTCLYVKDFHGNDPRFAYYCLSNLNLAHYNSGSAQPSLNRNYIHPLPLAFPELPEQKAIASILSSLDDKIELNRRMNETLEAMARAIFKDWFVDFGPTRAKQEGRPAYLPEHIWSLFPDAIDPDTGLPMGWEKKSIEELFNVSIGRTPPRRESQHFIANGKGKPWLSIKTMGNVQTYVFDTEENLTKEAVETFRVPLVPRGTVLISFKLTVGRIAIAGQDMYTNEAIAHLVHLPSTLISSEYIYCFMKNFDFSQLGSTSSIATAINSKSIKQIKVDIPSLILCNEFDSLIKPIFQTIRSNVLESRTLAELRDKLLPKLMSGEIRVKEAEQMVEEMT